MSLEKTTPATKACRSYSNATKHRGLSIKCAEVYAKGFVNQDNYILPVI